MSLSEHFAFQISGCPNFCVQFLNQMCIDERVKEVISKIQHHLDVLEHSVARVSSRAEVFGAVQQVWRAYVYLGMVFVCVCLCVYVCVCACVFVCVFVCVCVFV